MSIEFSESEKLYFKKMFNLYDTDKSGAIGLSELKNLSKHLGCEMTPEKILKSVRDVGYDVSNDVEMPFEGFLKWLKASTSDNGDEFASLKAKITAAGSRVLNNEQLARFKEVFDHFDADKSGSIDADELVNVFASMGQTVLREDMLEMIREVDQDGSGQIEFQEFVVLMCSNFGSKTFATDMEEAFARVDPDATGRVSVKQLEMLIRDTAGGLVSDEEIANIISSSDPNGGQIEYMRWEALWEACREQ